MWLRHDSGGPAELRNSQVLGDDSPLEFDEDGYAEVDAVRGEMLLTMHRHISQARPPETDDFDAAAFVDRTPMDDVVADIESGEYDAHLDAIEAEASRQGVLDALDERRE
jgi:hypothetical protein